MTQPPQKLNSRTKPNRARYEQLHLHANTLREELHTEVERILNDVIKFKVHVQKSLEDYEAFVVDEVEQELRSPSSSHDGGGGAGHGGGVDDEA